MLITKTGVPLDEINKNSVVELDIDKPSNLDPIASSETIVHRTIYKNTPALSIIHAHPFFSVIESMLVENETIVPINIEGEYFLHEIPVVKGATGSPELADKTLHKRLAPIKALSFLATGHFLLEKHWRKLILLRHWSNRAVK